MWALFTRHHSTRSSTLTLCCFHGSQASPAPPKPQPTPKPQPAPTPGAPRGVCARLLSSVRRSAAASTCYMQCRADESLIYLPKPTPGPVKGLPPICLRLHTGVRDRYSTYLLGRGVQRFGWLSNILLKLLVSVTVFIVQAFQAAGGI